MVKGAGLVSQRVRHSSRVTEEDWWQQQNSGWIEQVQISSKFEQLQISLNFQKGWGFELEIK